MLEIQIVWGGESHPFSLDNGEHSLGRASDNEIQVPIARVSKQHATLRVDGDRLWVRDLGSTNGTEVNGQRIAGKEVEIPAGTLVSFAGAMMRRAGGQLSSTAFRLQGAASVNTLLRYNMRQGYSDAGRDRIVRLSSKLFELLTSDAEHVEDTTCQFVSENIAADRVVLLANQGEGTSIEARARWTRAGDPDAPLQLSSTIVNQVLRGRDSVLVSNPLEDTKYAGQQSIMALNLRSAMAAPLFDNERVRGILYVDTAQQGVQYGQVDLEVLTATANAVAVKLRNIRFEKELRTAARIQRALLPEVVESPKGYEIDAYQVMCQAVGGDLYQSVRRPNGRVLLALGDVSGKGVPAALAMAAAMVLIGLLAEIGGEVDELAAHIHRQLCRSLSAERFITMFLAEIDEATGHMRYVNAGHEPPLILRTDGTIDALESTGLPVAMVEEMMPEGADAELRPGDLMVIMSDGVPEATTDGDRFLGVETVREILVDNRTEALGTIRDRVVTAIGEFLQGEPNSDDVTLLMLRRRA